MSNAQRVTDLSYQVVGPDMFWQNTLQTSVIDDPAGLLPTSGISVNGAVRAHVVASTRRYINFGRCAFISINTVDAGIYGFTANTEVYTVDAGALGLSTASAIVAALADAVNTAGVFLADNIVEGVGFYLYHLTPGTDVDLTAIDGELTGALEPDSFAWGLYGQPKAAGGVFGPAVNTWVAIADSANGPRLGKGAGELVAAASTDVANEIGQLADVDVSKYQRVAFVFLAALEPSLPGTTAPAVSPLYGVELSLSSGTPTD